MSDKFKNKYRIPSSRLQSWDYGWNAAYFITICTDNREYYFGEINGGKMELSSIGILADVFWHEINNHAKNIELGEFIVMPNHIHGILIINKPYHDDDENNDIGGNGVDVDVDVVETRHALSLRQSQSHPNQQPSQQKTIGQKRFQNQGKNTISSIIGSYKSAVTKHAHRLEFDFAWQSRFHDHIIRDEKSFNMINEYILNNPVNWMKDKFYKEHNYEKE